MSAKEIVYRLNEIAKELDKIEELTQEKIYILLSEATKLVINLDKTPEDELDKYHNEVIDFTATMKSIINRIVITRGMDKLDMNTK